MRSSNFHLRKQPNSHCSTINSDFQNKPSTVGTYKVLLVDSRTKNKQRYPTPGPMSIKSGGTQELFIG
jgi:hypothetical protein